MHDSGSAGRWRMFRGAISALAIAAGTLPALAADANHGAELASRWCASCHLLPGQAPSSTVQGPPSFRDIAHSGKTAQQLRTFLTKPHGAMPPLSLERSEIDDLVAYIESTR